MRQISKILVLVISGTFLAAGPVSADEDRRSERGNRYEQNSRDSWHARNNRPSHNRVERHDRHDRRKPHYVDNHRRQWEHDHDYRPKSSIQLRISTYPIYINSDRRYYDRYRPTYRTSAYDRPYYRDYGVASYPVRSPGYAPDRTTIYWNDNNTGGAVGSHQAAQGEGQYCREYYAEAEVQGRMQQVYGTACMQPDGSWKIIN